MLKKDIGYLIKNINDKLKVKADADLKCYNLTLSQSRVLAFLGDKGGRATQKELEIHLEVSHPTVVGIVTRLEQNGYLSCHLDANDKRNKIIELTDKAKSLDNEMKQRIFANEQKLLNSISEEDVEKLRQMLLTIYNNLE